MATTQRLNGTTTRVIHAYELAERALLRKDLPTALRYIEEALVNTERGLVRDTLRQARDNITARLRRQRASVVRQLRPRRK